MGLLHWLGAHAVRPDAPRPTVRLRLTLVYGALFILSAAAVLSIAYVLVQHATSGPTLDGRFAVVDATADGQGLPLAPGIDVPKVQQSGATPSLTLSPQETREVAIVQHNAIMHQLLVDSAIALGAMALVSFVLGSLVASRVLRPMRALTKEVREISATNLDRRLALNGPDDELKDLGETFNDLLRRLDSSFRSQRQFVANASHELRTPIAFQRTVVQVALADPNPTIESLRTAHERVLETGEQEERLIEALLTLARSERGLERKAEVDLVNMVDQVLATLQPEIAARTLRVETSFSARSVTGDFRLLERLVTNLLQNAALYNVPGGWIRLATTLKSGQPTLTVSNTGPVVRASEIERLLRPFQRQGQNRTGHGGGLGLGLSIVQAIAAAHDATLSVQPRREGGLDIEVAFPAVSGSVEPTVSGVPE